MNRFAIAASGLGATLAMMAIAGISAVAEAPLLIPPFGASCVLAFALPESPLAQPRNLIGGHVLSALVGLAVFHAVGAEPWAVALAVGLAIMGMQLTGTLHPPAGATPIVAMMTAAPWSFALWPVAAGALVLVAVATAFNAFMPGRRYPA